MFKVFSELKNFLFFAIHHSNDSLCITSSFFRILRRINNYVHI